MTGVDTAALREQVTRWMRDDDGCANSIPASPDDVLALLARVDDLERAAEIVRAEVDLPEHIAEIVGDALAVTKTANAPITKLTGDAGATTPETGSDNPRRRCAAASDAPAESVAVQEWRKASDLWQARAGAAEAECDRLRAELRLAHESLFPFSFRAARVENDGRGGISVYRLRGDR